MIPKLLKQEIEKIFTEDDISKHKTIDGPYSFLELKHKEDKAFLEKLDIEVDDLGPKKVVFMWEDKSPLEIGGYLVVDNLAMGKPSLGGTRFLPTVTPKEIASLARGMTLKNAAADLPYGGGKSGIIAVENMTPEQRAEIISNFAQMLRRYVEIYNPGPDVGTDDEDMKTFAIYNGLNHVVSKPVDMGGNRIDLLGAAAGGGVVALDEILNQFYKLKELPQFKNYKIEDLDNTTLIIQGFGAVGANVASLIKEGELLEKTKNAPKIIGVSDGNGYIINMNGLEIEELLKLKSPKHIVSTEYYEAKKFKEKFKFCNSPNDLLKESADILLPATPIGNYVGIDKKYNPCITIDKSGYWKIIVEVANTLSVEKSKKEERKKVEKILFRERGTFIATDYLVNSGGVIFAAYEKLVPTPKDLDIPMNIRGNREKVQEWLDKNKESFAKLAEERREKAKLKRNKVIRENITIFIDTLVKHKDMLPYQVAEQISLERIIHRDSFVKDVMLQDSPKTSENVNIKEVAEILVKDNIDFLPVVDDKNNLLGVVTDWDIAKCIIKEKPEAIKVKDIMKKRTDIIVSYPGDSIIETIKSIKANKVSCMPVVDDRDKVLGIVSSDLLVGKTLLRLLERK